MTDPIAYLHELTWDDLPASVQDRGRMLLLDLLGIGVAGAGLPVARIIHRHASAQFGGGQNHAFGPGQASAAGVALAAGCTIDGLDGHDGHNLSKGHVGCGTLAGLLGLAGLTGLTRLQSPDFPAGPDPAAGPAAQDRAPLDGRELLTCLVLGYDLGTRLGPALHGSVSDYHTSGAWVCVAVAGIGARLMGLGRDQTRHALGIAEYHGPRSQMMRCVDAPTMIKDGSGWGAMTGVSAACLAQEGFTGAPSLLIERDTDWNTLGQHWAVFDQYIKPYPVCRWAQAPIEAVLALRRAHDLRADDVAHIHIDTFHHSVRLATRQPHSDDAAQYSTAFPCAVAMVHGTVAPAQLTGAALRDPAVLRLSSDMGFSENATANAAFPARRLAQATLTLRDGRRLTSDWHEPRWDASAPASTDQIVTKFRALTGDAGLEATILALPDGSPGELLARLRQSASRSTTPNSSS